MIVTYWYVPRLHFLTCDSWCLIDMCLIDVTHWHVTQSYVTPWSWLIYMWLIITDWYVRLDLLTCDLWEFLPVVCGSAGALHSRRLGCPFAWVWGWYCCCRRWGWPSLRWFDFVDVWHDSLVCDMTRWCVAWLIDVRHDSLICGMTCWCVAWFMDVWHDSLMCDMTHWYVAWLVDVWHDSLICGMTRWCVAWFVPPKNGEIAFLLPTNSLMWSKCASPKRIESIDKSQWYNILVSLIL